MVFITEVVIAQFRMARWRFSGPFLYAPGAAPFARTLAGWSLRIRAGSVSVLFFAAEASVHSMRCNRRKYCQNQQCLLFSERKEWMT